MSLAMNNLRIYTEIISREEGTMEIKAHPQRAKTQRPKRLDQIKNEN